MVLYYFKDEIFLDFQTIRERVSVPESTLYRKIRNKCSGIRYRNKILFKYQDLITDFPDLVKEIKEYENQ
jgi:hypothetical protein